MTANLRAIADHIREIASRVRCLPAPSNRNPEAFHINRSEHAHELDLLAEQLSPRPPAMNGRKPKMLGGDDGPLPRSPRHR